MTARAQAISVVNHYSVLVDGIISGFKDHLAEDVTLKWFGHEIRGKENVAAFMLTNKKRSFHKFSNIIPVPVVSCKQSNGEMNWSMKQNINCETYTNKYSRVAHSEYETKMSTTCENSENYDQINYEDLIHKKACDKYGFCIEECTNKLGLSKDDDYFDNDLLNFNVNKNKFSANAIAAMDDQSYDLNKYELYNLFEPKITSQPIVGKIQKINRIKLKEEMAPTVRAINRECGQRDRPTVEANATKYLEANGEIKLVRIDAQTDFPFLRHWSKFEKRKFWKQQCKLQIAYSLLTNSKSSTDAIKCNLKKKAYSTHISNASTVKVCHNTGKIQNSKLPSLEEAIQVSNTLIKDVNNFGGYLQPLNFSEDREKFLKFFETKIKQKKSDIQSSVQYANNKLTLDYPNKKNV